MCGLFRGGGTDARLFRWFDAEARLGGVSGGVTDVEGDGEAGRRAGNIASRLWDGLEVRAAFVSVK